MVTAYYAAVIDGATPKTTFRYADDETPGHLAARLLCQAIETLPPDIDATTAIRILTLALHQENVDAASRPIASMVIYSASRHEVWMVGDCHFATLDKDQQMTGYHDNAKSIDQVLASWRRDIILSALDRGLCKRGEILNDDPGRRIIQPYITQQVRYQNLDSEHRFAFGVLDGEPVPERFIQKYSLPQSVKQLILATDGYPELQPTLADSETRLRQLLATDPLCIGALLGTKGVKPGQVSYDDRTYLRLEI